LQFEDAGASNHAELDINGRIYRLNWVGSLFSLVPWVGSNLYNSRRTCHIKL